MANFVQLCNMFKFFQILCNSLGFKSSITVFHFFKRSLIKHVELV